MPLRRTLKTILPLLMLGGTSIAGAAGTAPTTTPHEALVRLFAESDEAEMQRNPLAALFRGDMRHADRFGDYLSDAYFAAERSADEADMRRLHVIDRAALNETDQLAYDTFEWQTRTALKGLSPDLLRLTEVRPIDHFNGVQTFYPSLSSGEGAAPFATLADYENSLKRHRGYAAYIDQAIVRFRQGMRSGVVQPKLVVDNMIQQLDGLIATPLEQSTFYGPIRNFPAAIGEADRARLRSEYAATIREVIDPAHRRLRDFLKDEYRAAARDSVGLAAMPGGRALYAYLIEENTTLPLGAEEVHQLGLREVARIRGEMEAIRTQVGFRGPLDAFFTELRTNARFAPATREALREGYFAIGRRVDARIREQFSLIPRTRLEIKAVEPYRERTEAGGSYQNGTPDGSRPGVFYYNAYDLPSRYTWGMETLYLHEAIPGHHFQISLAQENAALPNFMRFGGNTAFVEGWALYAETLWRELGMESDPYQRMGGLNDEMLRAMRLVVDTGIHAKGWGRDQAIAYMLENSPMSRTDAVAEVERYIAMPGQALAYKVGALTILRLKAKAKAELGARFDPRAFHAQVLDTGALPMSVLEGKIDRWIDSVKAGG